MKNRLLFVGSWVMLVKLVLMAMVVIKEMMMMVMVRGGAGVARVRTRAA